MLSAESVSTDRRFLVGCWEDFWKFYDSGFEESDPDEDNAGDHVQIDSDARSDGHFETLVAGEGVKVLSEKRDLLIIFEMTDWIRNWSR